MKTKILLLIGTSMLLLNCKKEVIIDNLNKDTIKNAIDTTQAITHNFQNSLDWQGTYKGVTPCADCEGVETEIILNNDLTYTLKTKYLGKGDGKVFQEAGNFVWNKTGGIISLEGLKGRPSQYKVGENQLIQLDMEGKVIEGDLAEKYVLKK